MSTELEQKQQPAATPMKLVVFGATGGTGRYVLKYALEKGMLVRAYVRNPSKMTITHDRLEVVKGNLLDEEMVEKAMEGMDYAISVAGHSGKNYPKRMMENFIKAVIRGARKHQVKRVIYQAGAFNPSPGQKMPMKLKMMRAVFGRMKRLMKMVKDNDRVVLFLNAIEDVDWVITRPGMLSDKPSQGELISANEMAPGTVSFTDLAKYTVGLLDNPEYEHQHPYPGY